MSDRLKILEAYRLLTEESALFAGMQGDPHAATVKYSREMTWDRARDLIVAYDTATEVLLRHLSDPATREAASERMNTTIEMVLEGVQWKAAEPQPQNPDGLPWVTHEGVLEIAGMTLRCYRLSNGKAVFNGDDFEAFFGDFCGLKSVEAPE